MDDDASTRSALRWSNADYLKNNNTDKLPQVAITRGKNKGKMQDRPDKGNLDAEVNEPKFCSDPNHRRKQFTKELIEFEKQRASVNLTMTKVDAKRIGKNFGYFVRTLDALDESEYEANARAIIDHHFDIHTNCRVQWCKCKNMTNEQRFYRNPHNSDADSKLYNHLHTILAKYASVDRLKEVAHGMDTNCNESLNNTISYFAPKNRVFCGTRSLHNRVAIAIGINSMGFMVYFQRLLKALGIAVTPNVEHWLQVRETIRNRRLLKAKTNDMKKLRNKRKYEQMKTLEAAARKARDKREGQYKSGGHMQDGGFDGEETQQSHKAKTTCAACGSTNHKTTRSTKCPFNPRHPNYVPPQPQQQEPLPAASLDFAAFLDPASTDNIDADDVDDMDQLPII